MRWFLLAILLACLVVAVGSDAFGQGDWEFLGPGVGYRPDAFFVSRNAIYLGLSEEDWTVGLGLFRYRFDTQQWELLAWPGYNIFGVTVWGPSDENILVTTDRPGDYCYVQRSKDGGHTWTATHHSDYRLFRLNQAPSDTSHVMIDEPPEYSMDAGWSWKISQGGAMDFPIYSRFDPSNAHIAYCAGGTLIETIAIYKSTDSGANWRTTCDVCWVSQIDVDQGQTNNVMASTIGPEVALATDAGETWIERAAPFNSIVIRSFPWWPGCFFVAGSDLAWTSYEVRRTSDLGESWSLCGDGLPTPPVPPWDASMFLEAHPSEPTLYLALEGSGVWRWHLSGADAPDADHGQGTGPRLLLYPNPSSDQRAYGVRLWRPQHVALRLFDSNGRLVRNLQDGVFTAGTHIFSWRDAETSEPSPASGIYYLRLDAGAVHEERKIVVVK